MNYSITDYDTMLSQSQTYNTDIQGLIRALDGSLDEFMNPVCLGHLSDDDRALIIYGLVHEAKTIIGLMHSLQRTAQAQADELDRLYSQLIEGDSHEQS